MFLIYNQKKVITKLTNQLGTESLTDISEIKH